MMTAAELMEMLKAMAPDSAWVYECEAWGDVEYKTRYCVDIREDLADELTDLVAALQELAETVDEDDYYFACGILVQISYDSDEGEDE